MLRVWGCGPGRQAGGMGWGPGRHTGGPGVGSGEAHGWSGGGVRGGRRGCECGVRGGTQVVMLGGLMRWGTVAWCGVAVAVAAAVQSL